MRAAYIVKAAEPQVLLLIYLTTSEFSNYAVRLCLIFYVDHSHFNKQLN